MPPQRQLNYCQPVALPMATPASDDATLPRSKALGEAGCCTKIERPVHHKLSNRFFAIELRSFAIPSQCTNRLAPQRITPTRVKARCPARPLPCPPRQPKHESRA